MDIQKLLSQFVASLLQSAGFGGESSPTTEKTGVEIRREFQARIDRGDKISDEDLLAVPLHHVPAKLTAQWLEAKHNANEPPKPAGESVTQQWTDENANKSPDAIAESVSNDIGAAVGSQSQSVAKPSDVAAPTPASAPAPTPATPPATPSPQPPADPTADPLAKSPIAEQWAKEFSGQPKRSLADDLATINEATPRAVAIANEQNRTSFQSTKPSQPAETTPAKPAKSAEPLLDSKSAGIREAFKEMNPAENLYQQHWEAIEKGSPLSGPQDGLLEQMIAKARPHGLIRSVDDIRELAKASNPEQAAAAMNTLAKRKNEEANKPAAAKPATSPATQTHAAAPSVRDQWIQSQQPNADGTPAQPGTAGNRAELVHAITEGQDNASEGQPGPKQPQTSTPLPDDVVEANANGSPASEEPSGQSVKADSLQLGLDAVGTFGDAVVPGLGVVADGANAAISVGRMFTDPARAGEHAQNAAISTVSMVPFVGDLAKVFKGKRMGKTIGRASNMMKGSAIGGAVASAMTGGRKPRRETDAQRADNLHGTPDDAGQRESIKPENNGGGESSEQAGRPSAMPASGGGNLGGHADNFAQEQQDQEQAKKKSRLYDGLDGSLKGLTITAGALAVAFTGGAAAIAGFVGSKAWKLMERLETNNDRILGQNTGLAQYNGKLAESYAVSEAASIERGRNKADAVAAPISWLSAEQSKMASSMDQIRNPIEAMNAQLVAFQSAVVNKVNDIFGVTETVGTVLEKIAEMIGVEVGKEKSIDIQAFFQDLSDGKFDGLRPDFYEGGSQRIIDDLKDHKEVFGR